ncbi:MAG TPA: methyl-accepting chemotaxis protein, partial [Candidatus Kapabacteria bacterium]|nr:methyl-accepting chemotaxis protein [Candidatus Kapabacteria bacterium]
NETLDAVIAPVEEAGEVLNTMATGDLTVKVKGNYKGDHKKLQESINTLVDSFNDLIGRLLNSVETTASAAIQISSTADTMATSAQEQSAQTEEVASAIEQMARTVTENANNAQQTANVARQNREIAKEGGEIVELTVSKMSDIARVVKESADNIEKLGESSKQIGEIISVIDDIADQTNLLALNAAIEAARAGEQGRGFAVVADEVRKLAERTTEATKQIAEMIKGIQRDTEIAVRMMQNGNTEVTNGIQLADKAGAALKEIVDSSQHLLDMISQIATANEEQAATGEQITKNVAMISEVAQDSSRRVTEIAHSAEDLSRLTDELRELVSQFKIIQHEYEMSSQRTLTGKSNKYLSGRN